RAPFLLRIQTRLAAYEVIGDVRAQLEQADALLTRTERVLTRTQELRPILEQASALTQENAALVRELRLLVEASEPLRLSLKPLLADRAREDDTTVTALEQLVTQGTQLTENVERALHEVRELTLTRSEEHTSEL